MKINGKITNYEGMAGNIKGVDGKDYILLDKNIVEQNEELKENDNVEFEPEYFKTPEVEINMARFIKTLKR